MDLTLLHRRQSFSSRSAAPLQYGVLVATLEAIQSGSAAARAEVASVAQGRSGACGQDPLVELILGGAGWREAIAAQGGCFNAGHAQSRGKAM